MMILDILISFIVVVLSIVLICGISIAIVSIHEYIQKKLGKERYDNVVGRIVLIAVVSVLVSVMTAIVYGIIFT